MQDELRKLAALLRERAQVINHNKMTKAAQFIQAAAGLGLLARKIGRG